MAQLLDWIIIASLGVLWLIIPFDVIALVTQWFYNKVISVSKPSYFYPFTHFLYVGMLWCAFHTTLMTYSDRASMGPETEPVLGIMAPCILY